MFPHKSYCKCVVWCKHDLLPKWKRSIDTLNARYKWHAQSHNDYYLNVLGLDPNNMSNNISSPIGIGNYVGQTITLYSYNDAMNQLGDQDPSIVFNRLNFSDYTGYVPHNTAFDFAFPNLWAPLVQLYDNTTWIVQNFATPQMSLAPTFSGYDANALAATLPGTGAEWSKGNHPKKTAYINQNLDLIALSANLSDTQKCLQRYSITSLHL